MITRSKQNWQIGEVVKVGFITGLTVVAKIPTPGDYAPDAYALSQASTGRIYRFVPGHRAVSEYGSGAGGLVMKHISPSANSYRVVSLTDDEELGPFTSMWAAHRAAVRADMEEYTIWKNGMRMPGVHCSYLGDDDRAAQGVGQFGSWER